MNTYFLFATCLAISSPAFSQVDQTEPNDSISTATSSTLVAGSSGGNFSNGNNGDGPFGPTTGDSSGDMDFFSIPANAGQVIIFDVNSNIKGTGMDSVVGLYDSAGILLESNDDDGVSRDSLLRYTILADGIYYGVVASWVSAAADIAGSLPADATTAGTGQGVPGGAVDDYEVVILLDGQRYLTHSAVTFPLGNPTETIEGEVTLTNQGISDTTITEINFSGEGASVFTTEQTLPLIIPAGGEATINMEFSPAGSAELFEASLEIVSDDDVHSTLAIPLSEKGIEGLVFRLSFDDPVGSTDPADTSGNDFNIFGVVNGEAPDFIYGGSPIAGEEGTSVFINDDGRSGNYFASANDFPNTPTFTYSLWVRPVAGSGNDVLFNRNPGFNQNDGVLGCFINTSGAVVFSMDRTEVVRTDNDVVPDDSIHHIVVTHLDSTGFGDSAADRTRLYIDGVMVAENTSTLEVPEYSGEESNSRLWIATRSAAGQGFNGDMDEFQLYNTELDAEEVLQLFEFPNSVIVNAPPAPLLITGLERNMEGTEAVVTFDSIPGLSYALYFSDDLVTWQEHSDGIASQGGETIFTAIALEPEEGALFFRVEVE